MNKKTEVLDKLAFEPNEYYWFERLDFAIQGKYLSVLVNDEDYSVRMAVAHQGYGLDILINDEDWRVRTEVAKQGYGLDILVNDEDEYVREIGKVVLNERKK